MGTNIFSFIHSAANNPAVNLISAPVLLLVTLTFDYITEKKQENLSHIRFYVTTMLSFHAGIAVIYIIWSYFPHKSIWLVYIPLTFAFIQEILPVMKKETAPQLFTKKETISQLLHQNSGYEKI